MFQWIKKRINRPVYVVDNVSRASRGRLDIHSETWIFMMDYARAEIEKLRIKNDMPSNTEIQTAVIRGKIKALKSIIDLQNEKKGILSRHELDN